VKKGREEEAMSKLMLKTEQKIAYTTVPNSFIDKEMCDANGDFVKVYLYLLRCTLEVPEDFSIPFIADKFNLTENDVIRALRYWERKELLHLSTDGSEIIGICLREINGPNLYKKEDTTETAFSYYMPTSFSPVTKEIASASGTANKSADWTPRHIVGSTANSVQKKQEEQPVVVRTSTATAMNAYQAASSMKTDPDVMPDYDAEEDTRLKEIMVLAEAYLKKPLTSDESMTIYYFYDTLHFSIDLIEYLIEYCVSNDKRNMKYIEKVALAWAEKGIKTVAEAKEEIASSPSRDYYTILKGFGIRDRHPVNGEIEYMNKWTNAYGFDLDIILEACARTMKKGNQAAPFVYADKILANWYKNGVISLKDIQKLDAAHSNKRPGSKPANDSVSTSKVSGISKISGNNAFNNFEQRTTDYNAIEEQLSKY